MKEHSLLDDDVTNSAEMDRGNIFGDEYEVDDFDGVADGFRPDNDRIMTDERAVRVEDHGEEEEENLYHDDEDNQIHTISAHYSSRPVTPNALSRNSMRKSREYGHHHNPFSSPEDDSHMERRESLQFEPDAYGVRRSMSTTSSSMFARTNSPRLGHSGPSHPYGMYQQGTLPRSPSIATSSTIRPIDRRPTSMPRGPQHPYAMYQQGVDEDLYEEDADEQQPLRTNPIPVGFPGLAQNYTRRLGPDGEEQDIIGEDGHTEQLPPYSRYPDEGPEKMPLLMPTALHSRVPVAGTDPSMPLMHTLIQPEPIPQSMMDASRLSNRPGSMASMERLGSGSEDGAVRPAPKNWKDASWKEKSKIKFCGIPFWCYVLALVVISFIAAVLGSVIGGFVANHSKPSSSGGESTVTFTTSLYDASIIASPTSQAPSTGTYALSLGAPQQTQAQCLTQPEQQVAWSCDIVPDPEIAISVSIGQGNGQSGAQIFYAADIQIAYGAQASYMNTTFSTFLTVTDMDDPDAGPAFYFTAYYDKVVVVPEDMINATTGEFSKRDAYSYMDDQPSWFDPNWAQQKQVAQPSDKPWFCVWNGTYLEGFIYVDKKSNWTATPTSSWTTTSLSHSFPTTTPPMNTTVPPYSGMTPSPAPYSSVPPIPLSTASYGNPYHKRQGPPSNSQIKWNSLQVYPYLIKLEERRVANNPIQPYCQQYQILDNGNANWVGTGPGDSKPIIVPLMEEDPNFSAYESAGIGDVAGKKLRVRGGGGTVPNGCHCQWISGGLMPGQPGR